MLSRWSRNPVLVCPYVLVFLSRHVYEHCNLRPLSYGRFTPVPREHPGAAKPGAGKRLAGNKALEKQSYDAAVKHLTGSLGTKTGKRGPSGLRDLMGSLRFWVGLEGFTKATLLLMVGAGVGGLLLSDGRAAVAQTEFGEEPVSSRSVVYFRCAPIRSRVFCLFGIVQVGHERYRKVVDL